MNNIFNFIDFCDQMRIATEGDKINNFKKHSKNRMEAGEGVSILKKAMAQFLKEKNIPYKRMSLIPKVKRMNKGKESDHYEGEIRIYLKDEKDKEVISTSGKFINYLPKDASIKLSSNWGFGYDDHSPYVKLLYFVDN